MLFALNVPGSFAVYMIGMAGININIMLMVLNLLPIPPLDGGHIIISLLPHTAASYYSRLEPYGFYILLALLFFGVIDIVMQPAMGFSFILISTVFNLPLQL